MREIIVRLKPGEQISIKVIEARSGQPTKKQQVVEEYKQFIRQTADDVWGDLQSGRVGDQDNFHMNYREDLAKIAKKITRVRIPLRDLRQITSDVLQHAPHNKLPQSEIESMVKTYEKLLAKTS